MFDQDTMVHEPVNPQLTATDLISSQVYWVKASQKPLLDDETFGTWEVQFGLLLDDDGIWRCRGDWGVQTYHNPPNTPFY